MGSNYTYGTLDYDKIFTWRGHTLDIIEFDDNCWVSAEQLSKALGYKYGTHASIDTLIALNEDRFDGKTALCPRPSGGKQTILDTLGVALVVELTDTKPALLFKIEALGPLIRAMTGEWYKIGTVSLEPENNTSVESAPPTHKREEEATIRDALNKVHEELDELWEKVCKKPSERSVDNMKKEAIQIAAMGLRFYLELCGEQL